MPLELFVALRYLRAKRKQVFISLVTFISLAGVTAGVMSLNIALALNTGFRQEFQKRILGATSHITLFSSNADHLGGDPALLERLRAIEGVQELEPVIYGRALIRSEFTQHPVTLKAVDSIDRQIDEGLLRFQGDRSAFGDRSSRKSEKLSPIVLGLELANNLGALVGDRLDAIGYEGAELSPLGKRFNFKTFEVVGIFESGFWDFDANWALTTLEAGRDFLGMAPDEVMVLEFRLRDVEQAPEIATRIKATTGVGFTTATWMQQNRALFSALKLEKLALIIAIGLIVLVASLNIVSTLTLMVMDKRGDIAVLGAMGATPAMISRIFVFQGLLIGAAGTLLGDLLGWAAVWYLDTHKVFQLDMSVYSIPYVPFRMDWSHLGLVTVIALVVSYLATLYPARSAAKLDPVQVLRYE